MIHPFLLGNDPRSEPGRRRRLRVVATALALSIAPLGGCLDGGVSSGEGTVDISSAKGASVSNPHIAKAAAARGKAGMADAPKTRRK
jgi:hypothetical protein